MGKKSSTPVNPSTSQSTKKSTNLPQKEDSSSSKLLCKDAAATATQKVKLTKTSSATVGTSVVPPSGQLGMSTWPPGGSSQKHKVNENEEKDSTQSSSQVKPKVGIFFTVLTVKIGITL